MTLLKFEDFEYDSTRHSLKHKGKCVLLRPKASQLLTLLIENRDRVVTKPEILTSLWGSKYARDHLLFQLISELRNSPFNKDFIRTQPNLGYQWNAVTVVPQAQYSRRISTQVAASIAAVVVVWSATLFIGIQGSSSMSTQLPAQTAFVKGVIAMDKGDSEQAVEWFKFGLSENPDSAEMSLFLAESLLQQNKVEESSDYLQALLQRPHIGDYTKMTAADLLSRVRLRQGRLKDALRYAKASNDTNVIAQCSVDVVEKRLGTLTQQLESHHSVAKRKSKVFEKNDAGPTKNSEFYDEKCKQVKQAPIETSQCEPSDGYESYVRTPPYHDFKIS